MVDPVGFGLVVWGQQTGVEYIVDSVLFPLRGQRQLVYYWGQYP